MLKKFGFDYKKIHIRLIVIILILAAFLRFYNYFDRLAIAGDQSAFAITARYALFNYKLPLLGPFSSAGPFQTSGVWYWFVMVGQLLNPFFVFSPWVFLTLTYLLFIFILIKFGERMTGRRFALIAGLLAAVSPAQISQGMNLTNQSPLALTTLTAIWFGLSFIKTKSAKDLFLCSLAIGIGSSIHLQGLALIPLLILAIIMAIPFPVTVCFYAVLGLTVPWLPVFYADYFNKFTNVNNMVYYYLHDQYRISLDVLGRRWLTFMTGYLPGFWSDIIGGNVIAGYLLILIVTVINIRKLMMRSFSKRWLLILLSFLWMIIIVRYTRTPLFESFTVFLHPFVLLLTAETVYIIFKKNIFFAVLLLIIITGGSLIKDFEMIKKAGNGLSNITMAVEALENKHPFEKFALFDFQYRSVSKSLPLLLLINGRNRDNQGGYKIGLSDDRGLKSKYQTIYENSDFVLYDLNGHSLTNLKQEKWSDLSFQQIYNSGQYWYLSKEKKQ